jgi:HAD superfamily hydrolase (TIGR01549 family)
MIEAILFDLDGTLLGNDIDRFIRRYLHDLSLAMADFMPPEEFTRHLWAATGRTVENLDPELTNETVFRMAFDELSPCSLDVMKPAIDDFYAHQFGALISCTQRKPAARAVVETALARGWPAVVATNPIFPLTAITQRMEWAGVADLPFALITSYENMHFTKPHREYYQEIADRIGTPAERCLMVGDDWKLDRPAIEAGMRFFWVTDEPADDMQGSLEDLHHLILEGFLGMGA